MTETYIIPIAEALQQIDGNKYPIEYYYGFAWDGLSDYVTEDPQTDPNAYDQYKSVVIENFSLCN